MNSKGKTGSGKMQKPVLIKRLAGAVLVLVAAVAVGIAIRGYRFWSWERQQAQAQKAAQPAAGPKTAQTPKQPESQEPPTEEAAVEPAQPAPQDAPPPPPPPTESKADAPVQAETPAAPSGQDSVSEDAAAKERRGREALALVGHDPAADAVWIQAINDPTLSASARANLIEDLNEDGLQYRNLTTADLPVIRYRLELIEDLRPYAMDKVNADAFDEARKDLVNMEARLTGR